MSSRPFPKDVEVVCPNGHPICKSNKEIGIAEPLMISSFDWRIAKPVPGELMNCPVCGENYGGQHISGPSRFHTKDGWFLSQEPDEDRL